MHAFLFWFVTLWMPLFVASGGAAAGLPLVQDGQSAYTVVLPDHPQPAEIRAAGEITHYLNQAAGVSLPVARTSAAPRERRLWIGNAARARSEDLVRRIDTLAEQAFVVQVVGQDLVLAGGSPRGTLYAAYSFLETEVGVRWLNWYGEEYVPTWTSLALSEELDRHEAPVATVRDMLVSANLRWVSDIRTAEGGADLRNFLVRNRGVGPELSYFEIGYGRYPGGLSMTDFGGLSHTYTKKPPYFVHTFFKFVSPKTYFESHPDYFSLVNGQRTAEQLCMSHPQVRQKITAYLKDHLQAIGGRGVISISPEDNHIVCGCEACAATDAKYQARGASIIEAVALITRELSRAYPKVTITTLGYAGTEEPPVGLELPENLVIVFAPFHGLKKERLEGWAKIDQQIWIWYYPNTYASPLPAGILRKMADDFRFFAENRVTGYSPIEQDAPGVSDSLHLVDLQNWVTMKLMWNPHLSVDALIADFSRHYYGPAAPFLTAYATGLEDRPSGVDLDGEDLIRYQALLDQAEAAVREDPVFFRRVQLARLGLDRATILFWDRVTRHEPTWTLETVSNRFRERYELGLARIPYPAQREAAARGQVGPMYRSYMGTGFLDRAEVIRRALENRPTIPPLHPDQAMPQQLFTVLAVEDSQMKKHQASKWIECVDDALAQGGQAARMNSRAFQMGFYDRNQTHGVRGLTPGEIRQGQYQYYHVYRGLLAKRDYVFADGSWYIQFHDIQNAIEVDNPGQWWDIWLSVRFEGPAYDPKAGPEVPSRFYVDRLTLVKLDR